MLRCCSPGIKIARNAKHTSAGFVPVNELLHSLLYGFLIHCDRCDPFYFGHDWPPPVLIKQKNSFHMSCVWGSLHFLKKVENVSSAKNTMTHMFSLMVCGSTQTASSLTLFSPHTQLRPTLCTTTFQSCTSFQFQNMVFEHIETNLTQMLYCTV